MAVFVQLVQLSTAAHMTTSDYTCINKTINMKGKRNKAA